MSPDNVRRAVCAHDEIANQGWAVIEGLLTPVECHSIAALYDEEGRFRSRVVMARP